MDIYFSRYKLTPLKRANRMSSLEEKEGVFLRGEINGKKVFADYFPHVPLGDIPVDGFLERFSSQEEEYDKKILHLLLADENFQKKESQLFQNHQLWTGSESLDSKVVKYKLFSTSDKTFLEPLSRGIRVRLDANGLFNVDTLQAFLESIPEEGRKLIDYIEDPIRSTHWENLNIPTARDFLNSEVFDYYVYKPNCEFKPETKAKIIYSAYLGSELGSWHTYCEMIDEADKDITQGIVGQGYYKEERGLFKGSFESGIYPDENVVKNIYQELNLRNWKRLCSI